MKNHCLLAFCSSAFFFPSYFSPPLSQFQLLVVKIGDAWCLTLPVRSFNSLCTDSEDDEPPRFTFYSLSNCMVASVRSFSTQP